MRHEERPRLAAVLVEDEQLARLAGRAGPVGTLEDLEGHVKRLSRNAFLLHPLCEGRSLKG
jgi:hypothetical protein